MLWGKCKVINLQRPRKFALTAQPCSVLNLLLPRTRSSNINSAHLQSVTRMKHDAVENAAKI
jgi:hypothetical protein